MPKCRAYSIAFKPQMAREYLGGETLHGLARRCRLPRKLVH